MRRHKDWDIDVSKMMRVRVHFGHPVRRCNPRMAPYLLTQSRGIHIINLFKTAERLAEACSWLSKSASHKRQVLFVGTRSHASALVATAARAARCHYVNRKWLGGMLTNWATTKTRLQRLTELERQERSGVLAKLPKRESAVVRRQLHQLRKYLEGIKYMTGLPDMVVIIDPRQDATAIQECIKLDIPTICLVDTDCDPNVTELAIPANNDSQSSIQWILNKLVVAIREGRSHAASCSNRLG